MSDIRLCDGAVAELAPAPGVPAPALTALTAPAQAAPSHCGAPMEWRTPAPVALSVYSFDTRAAELPPVWCCRCGFQLDGVVRTPVALTELSR
ncbi:hypothetical protein QFZ65_000059 [Arthrobacter sp. B3I9]|jgi:hypothetical protein|uniref:hypothetical protein n=1 Tax=Arthrobacter sp. B3I9 TaxID=3042270 RepID=UPI00278D6100|nr:hypothetical protein [Arthrobacter sp. B3I9]MDQ0848121.1 hypothetical protein [Arthrobacter sp. B3I9]